MAEMIFTGKVKGYSEDESGKIHVQVEEAQPSEYARQYVDEMVQAFNPNSSVHGFGARDVRCEIRPGMAPYRFTLDREQAKGITYGVMVEVTLDVFNVRKVKFFNKRWAPINETRVEFVRMRALAEGRKENAAPKS